jgi:GTPase SAR1 family protein
MNETLSQVALFQEVRRSLAQLAGRLANVFTLLGNDRRAQALSQLESKLASERLRILVIGESSRGKSSLINALLGEAVVPVNTIPCTAAVQEIRWGATRRATLHFRQPLPSRLPAEMAPDVMVHLSRAESGQVPPMEVPVDRLEAYVGVRGDEGRWETPYSKVEILWPLALCQAGIEIIDTPGLDRGRLHDSTAGEHLPGADVVLFVLSCTLLGAATEMNLIDRDLRELGFEHLFFVCNRFDEIPQRERQRLTSFGRKKLAGHTKLGESGVWFVSALQALEGKQHGDMARLAESGLPSFERALLEFLHRDRGRLRLLQPTLRLLHIIHNLRNEVLPQQFEMVLQHLTVLDAKVEAARPHLVEAERANSQTLAELEGCRQELRAEARAQAAGFLYGIAARIGEWIDGLELEVGLRRFTPNRRPQAEALAREICTKVAVRLETELAAWRANSLLPLVNSRLARMTGDVSLRIDQTSIPVDQICSTVAQIGIAIRAREPSVSERIAAVVCGSLVAGIYCLAYWTSYGSRGTGGPFLTGIALYAIVYGLVSAMLGAGFMRFWSRAEALTTEAKRAIAVALAAQVYAGVDDAAQSLAEVVYGKTGEYVKRVRERLQREINGLHEQMRTILEHQRADEEPVRTRKELLVRLDRELREIDSIFTPLLAVVLASSRPPIRSAALEATVEPTPTTRILFLAADPLATPPLRLGLELREIREQLDLAPLKANLQLRPEMAARPRDVIRALRVYEPQIVHFSGHGDEDGAILVEDAGGAAHPITPQALASLIELFADKVQCLILNSCHSALEAAAVSQKIPYVYVIGMRTRVRDQVAISFSIGFYQALGAGCQIEECFAAGRALAGTEEEMHGSITYLLWKGGKAVQPRAQRPAFRPCRSRRVSRRSTNP